MDNAIRLQYLEAMGIDVWVSRHQPNVAAQTADGQSENVGWAEDCMDAGGLPSRAQGAIPGGQPAPTFAAFGTSCTSAIAEQSETHQDSFPEPQITAEQRETHQSKSDQSIGQSEAGYADTHAESLDSWDAFYTANAAEQARPHSGIAQSKHRDHSADQTWTDLQHEVASCRACGLCETRTQTVFGVGNKRATWMLIGEAPGQNEDLQGEPFVGKAGQLLTEMLRAIGLKREEVYIANILKCRPPNNRDPQAEEVAACHSFLQRQIALLQPKIILAVGRIAAQNLLQTQQPLGKLRGVRHRLDNTPLIVIHHPAYLLRSPLEKAKAWEDLQFALSVYKALE
jgi:DNA polymerase